jgi:peptidoglycan/xylan/chitin deacetylase (PgdA/CDA1 family)
VTRRGRLSALAAICAGLAACGDSAPEERVGAPPRVTLTAEDREAWTPGPPDRSTVPVLLYSGVSAEVFARHMALLDHAGYETITLDELARFVKRERVTLPAHPLLLTFDGARNDDWTVSDATLRSRGFDAVMFVNVGEVEAQNPEYLTWKELNALQRSGRWDVQLQSGTGHRRIRYGSGPDDVGPFYAFRGSEEVLGGWRERVFSDVTDAEQQLAHQVRGYRPLAFAPPYGNYGQAGTNDPRIPRELLARLLLSFELVFTQDRSGFASPGAANPLGRIEVGPDVTEERLHALLMARSGAPLPAAGS